MGNYFSFLNLTKAALRELQVLAAESLHSVQQRVPAIGAAEPAIAAAEPASCLIGFPHTARHPDRPKPQNYSHSSPHCGINDSNDGTKIQERIRSITLLEYFVLLYWGKPFFNFPRTPFNRGVI